MHSHCASTRRGYPHYCPAPLAASSWRRLVWNLLRTSASSVSRRAARNRSGSRGYCRRRAWNALSRAAASAAALDSRGGLMWNVEYGREIYKRVADGGVDGELRNKMRAKRSRTNNAVHRGAHG